MSAPGLKERCEELFVVESLDDTQRFVEIVNAVQPDLAIIGPEEPLAAGYVDILIAAGVRAFGPTRELAAIESSKSWTRSLLDKHGVPGNPRYQTFETDDGLAAYMEELGDFVVKPDGLTSGKGVRVFGDTSTTSTRRSTTRLIYSPVRRCPD